MKLANILWPLMLMLLAVATNVRAETIRAELISVTVDRGHYAFLAVVDPKTRGGVVGGWITHDRGDGVVFSPVGDGAVRMQAWIDYGRLRIKAGQAANSETFALGYFADARFGLEDFADAIAKVYAIKLHPARPGYCTSYETAWGGTCLDMTDPAARDYLRSVVHHIAHEWGYQLFKMDGPWVRATISSPVSREIKWRVHFEK